MKKTCFENPSDFFEDLDKSNVLEGLHYLRCRWEDEKEYEDFEDYKKAIFKLFNNYDFKELKIKKNFEIDIFLNNMKFTLKVNKTFVKYNAHLIKL